MPKYKKINNRRPTVIRADVSYLSKGIRRQIRVAYPATAETILAAPNNWQTLYENEFFKLRVSHATKETNWNMEGEAMFYLFFRDGRKVKIYRDELSIRNCKNVNMAIRRYLFPQNPKQRVRYCTIKRARSKQRLRSE